MGEMRMRPVAVLTTLTACDLVFKVSVPPADRDGPPGATDVDPSGCRDP